MRREILDLVQCKHISGCCPGHDDYAHETYSNVRSKRARSRDKKKEHRYTRRVSKQMLNLGDFE